jgi:hypothetical protein
MLLVAEASNRSAWLDFGIQVGAGVVAGLVAGAILLSLGYWLIDRRLHLKARRDQVERDHESQRHMREQVLSHVLAELMSNATLLPVWKEALSPESFGVPYPGFDVAGWLLISQAPALLVLENATISALAAAYYRMQSANGMLDDVADLSGGPTSLLASSIAAPWIDEKPRVEQVYRNFKNQRDQMRAMLIERLDELKPRLDDAIDAVERELSIATVPAAHRRFVDAD